MTRRRGFALIITLWAMVATAAIAASGLQSARDIQSAARNRSALTIAEWRAYGCAERAVRDIERRLWPEGGTTETTSSTWLLLDRIAMDRTSCTIEVKPSGVTANLNAIPADRMVAMLLAAGHSRTAADSMTDALLDWRDADSDPRAQGAERHWYLERGRTAPRNAALQDLAELDFVRGFAGPDAERYLGVEQERVFWKRAPRPVLASLPGMTPEALDVFERHRGKVSSFTSLGDFPELSPSARQFLSQHASSLAQAIADAPEAWTITARASEGSPRMTVELELRTVLADRHLIVTRRVMRP